jgi:hypothetical protein
MSVSVLELVSIVGTQRVKFTVRECSHLISIQLSHKKLKSFYYIHNKPISKQICKMRVSFFVNAVTVAGGLEGPGTSTICRQCVSPNNLYGTHSPFPYRVKSQDGLLSETF